ncbi:ATP-binding protein [Parasutterella secunda]|uniref:ATP-binding protein n=1 Tax=Parasutterella secunda TaxID=626947 RepID=UPI0025A44414|nr:ATP-binding protein [Parasutterella secunda]MDM8227491.1 ATP-binding protein [Parasutterella secunda]
MLKRKIEKTLLNWLNTENRNPLILKGCRQCGKTFSVLRFAQQHYKHVVYLNFFENPDYRTIFDGSLKVDDVVLMMSAFVGANVRFIPHETVIVLDEIQECPRARAALKFFKLDGRFDVLATGSLLGISGYRSEDYSVPVGYETIIDMFPLDFEEFLWANGIEDSLIVLLKQCLEEERPVPEALHQRMRDLLLQYVVVGGMPHIVDQFIKEKNVAFVREEQKLLIRSFEDDMVKYAQGADKSRIRECFESIPKQLARDNKKFQFSLIKKTARSNQYVGSLQWLEDTGLIRRCYNLTLPELPLEGNACQDKFKVYMADTGLFVGMLEDGTERDILQGDLFGYKGAIFENLVADFFIKMKRPLYYFQKDTGLEVDFVMRYKGAAVLLEVKATSGNTKSTRTILKHPEKYHVHSAIKLGDYNVGRREQLLTLPLYMGFLLTER